ncbi:MAG TPA: M13 family metallopeptidase [Polyangiales bacterium]|nr:M13 family metallopeptidase [Polyangiales bacterium]
MPEPNSAITVATAPPPSAAATQSVTLAEVGLDGSKIDKGADPCRDFYRYACGAWLDRTSIPADKPEYGTFYEIHDRNEALLHEILERAAREPGDDVVQQKIGAYYGACMDEGAIEKAGTSALEPLFALSHKVSDDKTLLVALANLQRAGVDVLFTIEPGQDKKDATKMIAQIGQGGLGLPDRDYYVRDDDSSQKLRAAYRTHVEKMFALNGVKAAEAKQAADDSFAIETAIAKSQKTRVELRDENGTYNRIDRAGLAKAAPLPWDLYFSTLGFPAISAINTVSVAYVEAFATIAHTFPPAKLHHYIDARILDSLAPYLPKRFVDEAFELARQLNGQKEQRPRWKRCIGYTDDSLGELLAQPYVAVAFGGDSKAAAERMTDSISRAFAANLASIDWMDPPTKDKARAKLAKIVRLIGYPDKWRHYDYAIERANYDATELAARNFESGYQLGKIDKPVDKYEWQMTPPTVNAYYDPQLNEMVFPAGILQRPFYDVKASEAVNLGGMGMIAGHELTHGFDDQGAQYDADGNLSGWWPEAVTEAFGDRTKCVANYYANYEALPGQKLNGELTLGENIADMGGVKMAFAAYRAARAAAKQVQVADGYSEDQQFFLAVAQAWCTKSTDELERLRLTVDPHSSPRFRVLGSLSSLPEFGEAFQCKAGAPMRPTQVCKVW